MLLKLNLAAWCLKQRLEKLKYLQKIFIPLNSKIRTMSSLWNTWLFWILLVRRIIALMVRWMQKSITAKGEHFFLGLAFGPLAVIGTAILAKPSPHNVDYKNKVGISQNKDQFSDPEYLMCYKKEAKKRLIGRECAGWAVGWGGMGLFYLYVRWVFSGFSLG